MSKHTPGPWRAQSTLILANGVQTVVAKALPVSDIQRDFYNTARIVACVNAMEGIDDPAAARVVLDEPATQHACDMLYILKLSVTREIGWEELRDALLKKVKS